MGLFGPPDIAKLKAKRDIAGLVKALIHPKDRSLAVPAADALGEIRDPRAVPLLIAALGDKDWKLRAAAAEALGKIGDPRAAQPLIAILVDSRWDVRSAAEEALEQLDARAVDPLVTALKDGGVLGASGVRGVAARTLGQIGDPRAVEPLVAALKDEASGVRGIAASALGQIGDPRAVEPLVAALKDENLIANREAAEALGLIGDPRAVEPLIAALKDQFGNAAKEAAEALGLIGDPRATYPLVALLADRDRKVREAAAQALDGLAWSPDQSEAGAAYWATKKNWDKCVEIGASAVVPLVTDLRSSDEATRRAAAAALAQIGGAGAAEALMPVFRYVAPRYSVEETNTAWNMDDDKNPGYLLAAEALVQIGAPAVHYLLAALADGDDDVCARAAKALGQIGDARAVEPLIAVLQQGPLGISEETAKALGQIGDARAVEPLVAALRSERPYWRPAIAKALGQIGDARAVEPLIAALKTIDGTDREAAASALQRLGVPPSQWLTAPSPPAGQAELALDAEANEPGDLRGEDAGASQPAATAGSAVQGQGDRMAETCETCASQIDHLGFTQSDATQVLAWRGQPGGTERRQALMRSVGGTCPGCGAVCCSKCYYDQKFTCPGCQSKIPELGGG